MEPSGLVSRSVAVWLESSGLEEAFADDDGVTRLQLALLVATTRTDAAVLLSA